MTDPKTKSPTKLVLLDFDGVINDNAYLKATTAMFPGVQRFSLALGRAMLDPVRCERVQRICDATGAGILLVTGWRRWTEWENLAELLKDHSITARVVGAVGGVRMSGETRASATEDWLKRHPHVTRYVVIDDDTHHWETRARYKGEKDDKPWAEVLISPKDGIEDDHVEKAIVILNRE